MDSNELQCICNIFIVIIKKIGSQSGIVCLKQVRSVIKKKELIVLFTDFVDIFSHDIAKNF